MLVTIGIRFKQHFDTKYFAFFNLSPPRMFLSLDLLSEYRIQNGTIGPLYVTSRYSTRIFYRGVSGFATDCPRGVWCRGLPTCLLYVGPLFGNRLVLKLPLIIPLKPGAKWRMKSDQQAYCMVRFALYWRFVGYNNETSNDLLIIILIFP